MAKPAKVESQIRAWLGENGHDELIAFARVKLVQVNAGTAPGTMTNMTGISASPDSARKAMGLEDRENVLIPGYTYAFVLTRSKFLALILSSVKERPKELWVESPADDATLYHLDAHARRGHLVRYLALDLPNGRLAPNGNPATFVLDSFVHTTKGGERTPFADASDAFIAAFGDRAHRFTPA